MSSFFSRTSTSRTNWKAIRVCEDAQLCKAQYAICNLKEENKNHLCMLQVQLGTFTSVPHLQVAQEDKIMNLDIISGKKAEKVV